MLGLFSRDLVGNPCGLKRNSRRFAVPFSDEEILKKSGSEAGFGLSALLV